MNTPVVNLSILGAYQVGTQLAAFGKTEAEVAEWIATSGYKTNGWTAQRLTRAYREQIARG